MITDVRSLTSVYIYMPFEMGRMVRRIGAMWTGVNDHERFYRPDDECRKHFERIILPLEPILAHANILDASVKRTETGAGGARGPRAIVAKGK